jgi:HD superfamily phosphohydrolase
LPDSSTGVWTICWPEKLAEQLMKVFRTRFELHQAVYQHKVTRAIEYMICDALLEADSYLNVRGSLISQAPLHMVDDHIVHVSILMR